MNLNFRKSATRPGTSFHPLENISDTNEAKQAHDLLPEWDEATNSLRRCGPVAHAKKSPMPTRLSVGSKFLTHNTHLPSKRIRALVPNAGHKAPTLGKSGERRLVSAWRQPSPRSGGTPFGSDRRSINNPPLAGGQSPRARKVGSARPLSCFGTVLQREEGQAVPSAQLFGAGVPNGVARVCGSSQTHRLHVGTWVPDPPP